MTAPKSVIKYLALAAEWYAKHGYYVFPCWPGTKKPATSNGLDDATTDLARVRAWWKANPNFNIGINCGLSGLLVVDRDLYKTNAEHTAIAVSVPTITVNTARGGIHDWYRMPVGKTYGNSRGTLPKWLDIRGFGGYVMAPPSVFVEDGKELPYTFATGCKPTEIELADLPADIAVVLDAAQASRAAVPVNFMAGSVPEPDLAQWPFPDSILDLIHNGAAKGGRSEADQSVITAMARCGATDDDIRAVFVHCTIGEKYREKGSSGDKYLAYSIGKARAWLEDHPPDAPPDQTWLPALRDLRRWAQGAAFAELLRDFDIARPADYAKTLIAVANRAIQRGAPRIRLGSRQLGELANTSHMTAKRHLAMLGEGITVNHNDGTFTHRPGLNLVKLTDDTDGYGKWIDLTDLLRSVTSLNLSTGMGECNTSQQFADDHLQDEAFILYPRHFAVKMRLDVDILPHGLSAAALFIAATLSDHGELTRSAICDVTGLSQYTVGKMLRRMASMGLLVVYTGKPYRYDIHPNFEEVLDELRPLLPSYEITKRRGYVNAEARRVFINRQLNAPEAPEPRAEAKLRVRRQKCEEQRDGLAEAAAANGVDITVKLAERKPPPEVTNHREHLARLSILHRHGERADRRLKRHGYTPKREGVSIFAADAEWEALSAWAQMEYGAGWWVRRDVNGILGAYEGYLVAQDSVPTMHFDGVAA